MRRILNLKTPLLSLVLAVTAEVLLFVAALLAGRTNSPDQPVLAAQFFGWFHRLPDWLTMSFMAAFKPFHDIRSVQAQITVTLMIVFFALLEWYIVFLIGIGLFRKFYHRPAANETR